VIVGEPKWVFSLGEGGDSIIGVDPRGCSSVQLARINAVLNASTSGPRDSN